MTLTTIPVLDGRGRNAAQIADLAPGRVADILRIARRRYTALGIAVCDRVSRWWMHRNRNPYLPEIDALANRLRTPGAHMLNASYEWSCTTGSRPSLDGRGQLLVRVLDWDLDGLGRNAVVIRQSGPAGDWLNIGWPGFAGVVTGLAPGRFGAAINLPPMADSKLGQVAGKASPFLGLVGDWIAARPAIWRSSALPPAHLLRRVFDEAPDYEAARRILTDTPISAPAYFTLAGTRPGEGCVIERTQDAAFIRHAQPTVAVANHWVGFNLLGRLRSADSHDRMAQMERLLASAQDPFALDWVRAPILNRFTRMVAVADPATGRLVVQGVEHSRAGTEPLALAA